MKRFSFAFLAAVTFLVLVVIPSLSLAAPSKEPEYHLTTVSWVLSVKDDINQDDRYVTLIGRVTKREGDETYFFDDGTGTIRLDSANFALPVGERIVVGGRIDQAYLGFGHLEVDVRQWKSAKRH